jgi:hypothetical protein
MWRFLSSPTNAPLGHIVVGDELVSRELLDAWKGKLQTHRHLVINLALGAYTADHKPLSTALSLDDHVVHYHTSIHHLSNMRC